MVKESCYLPVQGVGINLCGAGDFHHAFQGAPTRVWRSLLYLDGFISEQALEVLVHFHEAHHALFDPLHVVLFRGRRLLRFRQRNLSHSSFSFNRACLAKSPGVATSGATWGPGAIGFAEIAPKRVLSKLSVVEKPGDLSVQCVGSDACRPGHLHDAIECAPLGMWRPLLGVKGFVPEQALQVVVHLHQFHDTLLHSIHVVLVTQLSLFGLGLACVPDKLAVVQVSGNLLVERIRSNPS
mmetsp:Transcript_23913/g.42159  ORF Transcript_23913/g.42159 Transcript_23913/m.42159 type:complete len:239 (+) Transcript_23913:129-845(+)